MNMNKQPGGACGTRRAGPLAATLVVTAVLAVACGNSPETTTNRNGESRYQQAAVYAQCIRSHGYPAFPNPDSRGAFVNNGSLDLSSPQYLKAAQACKNLRPAPNTAAFQRGYQQGLKFSACMRAHGIADFPDPAVSGTGTSLSLPKGLNTSSPQFRAAQLACRSLMPGAGRSS